MSSRERRTGRAAYLINRDMQEVADSLREARLRAGLALQFVADAIGTSPSTVLRRERGAAPGPRPEELAKHAAVVGLRARIRLYSEDAPLRDGPQITLLNHFRRRLHPDIGVELEAPVIAIPGRDARAFDLLLRVEDVRAGVEGFTRFRDTQHQVRSCLLKQRDAGVERLLVVVKATRQNRLAVATAADLIATTLPLGTREVLAALAAGRDPGANGLIFL